MRRSVTALSIVFAGAILAFAVTARVPGLSLRAGGVILMLAGLVAAVMPPSPAADWLRHRRASAAGPAGGRESTGPDRADAAGAAPDDDYPAWLLQDPAVLAAEVLAGIRDQEPPGPPADRVPAAAPAVPSAAARARGGRPAGPRTLRSVPPEARLPEPLRLDDRLRRDGDANVEWLG